MLRVNNPFVLVGIKEQPIAPKKNPGTKFPAKIPWISLCLLCLIFLGCISAPLLTANDPSYLDLEHRCLPPCLQFPFGTDTMGRDLFAGIWYGGRISLLIGFFSTLLSTGIAMLYGSFSALAPRWVDALFMRIIEIFLSIPGLILILFLQAILGEATVGSLTVIIGVTSWFSMAKLIHAQVLQIRSREYVLAARCMGCGFSACYFPT